MLTREFFYDTYLNHPETTLKKLAGEYQKLNPQAQIALREVLTERNLEDILALLKEEETKKTSLAHLSTAEIRALIHSRLDKGEKAETIKADLEARGVTIFDLSYKEIQEEDAVKSRFVELQREGKTKSEIDVQLKEEFNLSGKEPQKIPDAVYSNGAWLIVIGAVALLIGLPMGMVTMESKIEPKDYSLPVLLVGAGALLLVIGLVKRMKAQKFIKESESV